MSASKLDEARGHLRGGRIGEAETLLREVVAAAGKESVQALELLGAALGTQGRHAEALAILDDAIARDPGSHAVRYNRALALLAVGRAADARVELDRVLATKGDFPQAWTALGRAWAMLGDGTRAEQAFRKALAANPQMASAHMNLAHALRGRGQRDEALRHYAEALRLAPASPEALSNYAAALQEAGRHAEAVPLLERAVAQFPAYAPLFANLGVAYYHVNRLAEAQRCQRRAIELDPASPEAWTNLGNVFGAQGRTDDAIACYRRVVEGNPGNADAQSNLGYALQEKGDIDGAIVAYRDALAARADHPDALNNVGFLLQEEGRRAEAIEYYERALAVNPRSARAEYNLGLARLAEREWEAGWRHAEARFAVVPPIAVPRTFPIPRLASADLGRVERVGVWSEQGIGDQLLYATLLPDLAARGIEPVLEIDARLVPAFRRTQPWTVVAPPAGDAFAKCERHVPLGSLGALLRTRTEDFDRQPSALLAADAMRVQSMRDALRTPGRRLVGISWRSFQPAMRAIVQRRKSTTLAEFLPISRRGDIELVDLQYGDTVAEREAFAAQGGRLHRVDGLDLFNDIDGVLAAIEACDLVITTSNVTAHFAGALGKEAWLVYLAAVPPFHYWSTDESGRCLWYPSVHILTAPEVRTWPELFRRIESRLA